MNSSRPSTGPGGGKRGSFSFGFVLVHVVFWNRTTEFHSLFSRPSTSKEKQSRNRPLGLALPLLRGQVPHHLRRHRPRKLLHLPGAPLLLPQRDPARVSSKGKPAAAVAQRSARRRRRARRDLRGHVWGPGASLLPWWGLTCQRLQPAAGPLPLRGGLRREPPADGNGNGRSSKWNSSSSGKRRRNDDAPCPGLRRLDGAAGAQAGDVPDCPKGTAASGVRCGVSCGRGERAEALRLPRARGDVMVFFVSFFLSFFRCVLFLFLFLSLSRRSFPRGDVPNSKNAPPLRFFTPCVKY